MSKRFTLSESGDGKCLYIDGPWELDVEINHDDVWHSKVEKEARKLCKLLNEHWPRE